MRLIEREGFSICGYSVDTNQKLNKEDIYLLYRKFMSEHLENNLRRLKGSKEGYYGLIWNQSGERKCYMLGVQVESENTPPEHAHINHLPRTRYAVSRYSKNKDIMDAWTEFYQTDILKLGWKPDESQNFYFEYYPESLDGDYELWVPVVRS